MDMEPKKLYRSRQNRMLSGVCGGIAEYFNVDATIIRLIAVLIGLFSAGIGGLIAYVICAVIIPQAPM